MEGCDAEWKEAMVTSLCQICPEQVEQLLPQFLGSTVEQLQTNQTPCSRHWIAGPVEWVLNKQERGSGHLINILPLQKQPSTHQRKWQRILSFTHSNHPFMPHTTLIHHYLCLLWPSARWWNMSGYHGNPSPLRLLVWTGHPFSHSIVSAHVRQVFPSWKFCRLHSVELMRLVDWFGDKGHCLVGQLWV